MALNSQERQEFLAQPHIGALAVSDGPDRAPLTLPIWYQYTPGGDLWVLTGATSRKLELIRAAGRFSLMAEIVTPSVRYVSVSGPVTVIEPMTDAQHEEMVRRYLPGDKVAAYLAKAATFGPQVVVSMRPEHWLSADLGAL
ncbi:pyridoxamine 5-phosphate oxidase [Nocardia panacis]|uniref:Pyridoxamine 5-phosphate oxidase n=1 Tax=Nocardia panacis TaxID=2340916 RepID=A0A3A4JYW9_9NOCA|nr:pyridoxamine 5'-phosphate oxidase family protein [Nocardia panacis]RJO68443.1 pyridoxamine 5-phosphate oxidase [Nocardia panacis]